ncbi:MAG TPA: hypothetical protein VHV10_04520 [Ktedonobacteraceae bacterium]|jgi:hypothetical protein|nr:hypothetical protein [Ktedonobacteraceae bacterium]
MSDELSPLAIQVLELAKQLALQEARIAELEAQISQTKNAHQSPQTPIKRRNLPSELPDGSVSARDFYAENGLPLHYVRSHVERGIYGDFLETTDIPHKTRQGFKFHYLTPEQQKKAIEFWDRNHIEYKNSH